MINTLYPPILYGGAERSIALLARGLTELGHTPTILSIGGEDRAKTTSVDGVNSIVVPLTNLYNPWLQNERRSRIGKTLWHTIDTFNPWMAERVRQTLRSVRPDIVHTNNLSGFSPLVWRAIEREGVPIVHTLRDYWLVCPKTTMFRQDQNCAKICLDCRLLNDVRRRFSQAPRGVAGVSSFIIEKHRDAGYFPRASVVRPIINSIDQAAQASPRRDVEPGQPVRFGFIGTLHPTKGIESIIEALARLPTDRWHLVVAGRGASDYMSLLRSKVASLPVEFLGFVSPDEFYENIDVVTVPSVWHDPLPRVLLEAFSRGIPVIASRRGGIPEIVSDQRNGLLYDPDSPHELTDALRLLIEDPLLIRRLGQTGRSTVAGRTRTSVAEEYVEFYRTVLREIEADTVRARAGSPSGTGLVDVNATTTHRITQKRPHILLVNNLYAPQVLGGAEVMVQRLAHQLDDRGFRVSVVTTCAPGTRETQEERIDGISIHRFFPPNVYWMYDKSPRGELKKLSWRTINLWNPLVKAPFEKLCATLAPDIVHTHNISSFSPVIWSVAKKLNLPLIHTAHDYYLLCPRWNLMGRDGTVCTTPSAKCRAYRAWLANHVRKIDTFCAPSHFLLDQHKPFLASKVRAIQLPNGIPLRGASLQGDRDQSLRFLFLGQLTAAKGVSVILDALALIPAGVPVELHIAGTGPLEAQVLAKTGDIRLVYHGFVSGGAREALMERVDVLLFPSLWYENGPYSIMEAMDAGLAILASGIGSIPEFVVDGVNGRLLPPGSPQAWADAMIDLVHQPEMVHSMRQAAQAKATRYDENLMIDSYVAAYQDLVR
jgi:glycosyltransferase involved in cell wall biosynthesis